MSGACTDLDTVKNHIRMILDQLVTEESKVSESYLHYHSLLVSELKVLTDILANEQRSNEDDGR